MTKVHFRTNIELKSIIGKDLITDDNIAVLELVKNSFDAGSPKVDIIFENVYPISDVKSYKKSNESSIIISDQGKGMSHFDIENKWLNIAYSEKKEKKEEYGRTLAGNKGVGRFSCDRLGKYLTIYTKQEDDKDFIALSIDWSLFEKNDDINLNIQDVEFELYNISPQEFQSRTLLKPIKSGTILAISSLREVWHYEKILALKRQLEKLINPNQSFKSSKFDINIIAKDFKDEEKKRDEYERINGLVKNQIFEKLNFKVTSIQAKITRDRKFIISILKDRGNTIFTLVERNPFKLLGNIKTHIYYLNPYSKAYFTKQTGIRPVDFGSISLFINGFRIPPYGDYGDDWLGMESRKHQGRARYLGTREVIGRIEVKGNNDIAVDEENDVFKIISSRSGIVNNEIYLQLAKSTDPYGFYYKIFRRLERFVVEGIKWDSVVERNYQKLEKEVLSSKWDESKEKYIEDSLERNKRVLSVVQNIIDTRKEELVRLKINQKFVSNLIEEQKQKINKEIEYITNQINRSHLSTSDLNFLINRLESSNKELEDFDNRVGENIETESLKNNLEENIRLLKQQKEELEIKLKEEEENRRIAEENRKKIEDELAIEKDKNTYLLTSKRSMSEDAKGLIHNVKQTSKRSRQNAKQLYDAFVQDNVKKPIALKLLSAIIYNSEKALKISNLITRANFKANQDYQDVNIVNFLQQYLDLYSVMYEDNELSFSLSSNVNSFWKRISILDISLIIDDLISNSVKASAKSVEIVLNEDKDGNLQIIFSDDGIGLSPKFEKNSEAIFELGVTTTDGSGIGLNYVRNTLTKMQGKIKFVGNGRYLKGAAFEIKILKSYK